MNPEQQLCAYDNRYAGGDEDSADGLAFHEEHRTPVENDAQCDVEEHAYY